MIFRKGVLEDGQIKLWFRYRFKTMFKSVNNFVLFVLIYKFLPSYFVTKEKTFEPLRGGETGKYVR